MVILVTDGVGEGNLGIATTFCHHNQAKMGASETPLCPKSMQLVQAKCGCSEEVHQHPLYISRVLLVPLSRHEHSLSRSTSSTQFPMDCLHICRLLPYSDTKVVLLLGGGIGVVGKCFHTSGRFCGKAQKRSTVSLTQFCCQSLCWPSNPHQEEGNKAGKGLGFYPTFKHLQDINQARVQLECELAQETQGLA